MLLAPNPGMKQTLDLIKIRRFGSILQTSGFFSNSQHRVTSFRPPVMSFPISTHISRLGRRNFAVSLRRFYSAGAKPPPFPVVPTCPSPTCECSPTPAMPDGLEIDHKGKLNGLISGYNEHVLICTGKDDWPSRIEEDNSGDNLAADLKELFGRGGVYSDVSRNINVII